MTRDPYAPTRAEAKFEAYNHERYQLIRLYEDRLLHTGWATREDERAAIFAALESECPSLIEELREKVARDERRISETWRAMLRAGRAERANRRDAA